MFTAYKNFNAKMELTFLFPTWRYQVWGMLSREVNSKSREFASKAIHENSSGHLASKNLGLQLLLKASTGRGWDILSRQATEVVKPGGLGNMGVQIQVRTAGLKGSSTVPYRLRKGFPIASYHRYTPLLNVGRSEPKDLRPRESAYLAWKVGEQNAALFSSLVVCWWQVFSLGSVWRGNRVDHVCQIIL